MFLHKEGGQGQIGGQGQPWFEKPYSNNLRYFRKVMIIRTTVLLIANCF